MLQPRDVIFAAIDEKHKHADAKIKELEVSWVSFCTHYFICLTSESSKHNFLLKKVQRLYRWWILRFYLKLVSSLKKLHQNNIPA